MKLWQCLGDRHRHYKPTQYPWLLRITVKHLQQFPVCDGYAQTKTPKDLNEVKQMCRRCVAPDCYLKPETAH